MLKRLIPLTIVAILAGCSPAANYAVSPLPGVTVYQYRVYLPQLQGQPRATPTPRPTPTSTPKPSCYRTTQAAEFARLLSADARQQRKVLRCNLALVQAAQVRAESLAKLGYFAHCDPSGVCPNAVAIASGCRLPSWYPVNKNSIESLSAGLRHTKDAFDSLARSVDHARHIFGEVDFFRDQTEVGIAYVEVSGSRYTYYWVVMTAICEANNNG